MLIDSLYQKIKALTPREKQQLLVLLFEDPEIASEIERIGYLRLSENAFDFWNDPREDIYQDYAKPKNDNAK